MKLNWKSLATESEVMQAMSEHLPGMTTVQDVLAFATEQDLECSDLIDNVIQCSIPTSSDLSFVKAKWLVKFHFSNDQLMRLEVRLGLIGP